MTTTSSSSPAFRLETGDDGIATLTFDMPGSSANVFNHETLAELEERLDEVEQREDLKGLVVASAKSSIFIAGADLKALSKAEGDALADLIQRGQSAMNRLAALRCPTVA
ncbi:MAG: hypothetical protein HKO57_10615, partial [Akkermansiaceae bacterium]|nr:hypothetical protein [Akkermansiaceae bacterium]